MQEGSPSFPFNATVRIKKRQRSQVRVNAEWKGIESDKHSFIVWGGFEVKMIAMWLLFVRSPMVKDAQGQEMQPMP